VTESGPSSTYDEPAKSYRTLWVIAAFFAAGFALDIALGGALVHLPGWLIAFALVAGVYALFIYAARSERSLHLTEDELRVGDDAINRAEIVALAPTTDDDELPVLGWPLGRPRSLKGVTLRLDDGQDVVVPTRFPARLQEALGVKADAPARGQDVRAAGRGDLALLDTIGNRADQLFRTAGYDLPEIPLELDALAAAKAVFVAGRPPIGFVQVIEVDGLAHIAELGVIPRWMRQGIGSALLERACEWARTHDYRAVTLITYADVPWNGPYYASRGFVEIEPTPGLLALREHEAELGLDAVGPRIVMRRELRPLPEP
jgi:GNAT superfamily N-acetyltransferase